MIYGEIRDALKYCGIYPGLDAALAHLTPEFFSSLGEENVNIKDDEVYAFKVFLETLPESETLYENHLDHIDIHVVLEGAERIDVEDVSKLKLCKEQKDNDAYFYTGEGGLPVILKPGTFLVVFPGEAHRTCGIVDVPARFVKSVFKIHI